MTQSTQSRFDQLITETGFLTTKGREEFGKTLGKGVTAFLGELYVDGKNPSSEQKMMIKSLVLKEVSDEILNIFDKLNK